MSSLSTDVTKVFAVILHYPDGFKTELAEYIFEDDAEERAKDAIQQAVAETNEYYYCTIEKRIVPIYK